MINWVKSFLKKKLNGIIDGIFDGLALVVGLALLSAIFIWLGNGLYGDPFVIFGNVFLRVIRIIPICMPNF